MPRTVKQSKDLVAGPPAKPQTLTKAASAEWDRLMGELAASGIEATPAHRTAMALAANIATDITDAEAVVSKQGAYIEGKAGLVAHPAVKRLDALRRDLIKVLAMLGLRAAVATGDTAKEESLDEMVGG